MGTNTCEFRARDKKAIWENPHVSIIIDDDNFLQAFKIMQSKEEKNHLWKLNENIYSKR